MKYFVAEVLMLLFVSLQSRIEALNYSDVEAVGFRNCPTRNRCSEMENNSFEDRMCECDSECATYGDCCIDADRSSEKTSTQMCMQFGDHPTQAVYVINTCPKSSAGDDEFRRLCLNDDFHDLEMSAPVTDTFNQRIYLNRYCALCNEASADYLTSWRFSRCSVEAELSENLASNDIYYMSSVKQWVHRLPCKIIFDKPPSVSTVGRSCRPNLISSCPSSWTVQDYIDACQAYMAVVKDSRNNLFRNPHCALCNGIAESELTCAIPARLKKREAYFPFTLLNNYKIASTYSGIYQPYLSNSGKSFPCPAGEKYDTFFKKCRPLVCAMEGFTMKNGKCVKL